MLTWNTNPDTKVVNMLLESVAAYALMCKHIGSRAEVDPSLCLQIDPKTGHRGWISREQTAS